MLLLQYARAILNGETGATFHDVVEAYKFMNDNFLLGELSPAQQSEFQTLVESGVINTPAFQG
jgi:hypothetical protein